jgi:hypothetical protein
VEFKQLPLSTYEVRVECPGWKTVVRRVILSETDNTQALLLKMNKSDGTVVSVLAHRRKSWRTA